ncbi:MAG: hypothetical protein KME16_10570 [Scytolyngbya sp. HA4215-MV1]|nr:hypothetical protein [Scytolyngbya sp. HA4215-MV1]
MGIADTCVVVSILYQNAHPTKSAIVLSAKAIAPLYFSDRLTFEIVHSQVPDLGQEKIDFKGGCRQERGAIAPRDDLIHLQKVYFAGILTAKP